jgi:hypothetical protein
MRGGRRPPTHQITMKWLVKGYQLRGYAFMREGPNAAAYGTQMISAFAGPPNILWDGHSPGTPFIETSS